MGEGTAHLLDHSKDEVEGVGIEAIKDIATSILRAHQHGRVELGRLDKAIGITEVAQRGVQGPHDSRPVVLDRRWTPTAAAATEGLAGQVERVDLVDLVGADSRLERVHEGACHALEDDPEVEGQALRRVLDQEALACICGKYDNAERTPAQLVRGRGGGNHGKASAIGCTPSQSW
jgi:hypothetical protein